MRLLNFLLATLFILVCASTATSQQIPDNIDISTGTNGIVLLPEAVPARWHNAGLVKYTKIMAPNGQAIHFVAQNFISDEQIIRSREILRMYLTDVPASVYGSDKSTVANLMGNNEAVLMMLNGSDSDNAPYLPAQPLYQNEMAVEGHPWYVSNDYDNHRDASFEEILHLMHDFGVGIDGNAGMPGALPAFQSEIRIAQENASANNFQIWPILAFNIPEVFGWYQELQAENSLTQEYLAAVIDCYYGLWGAWTESDEHGMHGLYIAKTRGEIESEDPLGWALLPKYFSPYLTYTARIYGDFNGTFSLEFDTSEPYTHKSQYLLNARLLETNNSNLKGNDQDNKLQGNRGDNTLTGGHGNDTAIFVGTLAEYEITLEIGTISVTDNTAGRDGTDLLVGMEWIQFSDQTISAATVSSVETEPLMSPSKLTMSVYPNPVRRDTQIRFELPHSQPIEISIYDVAGRLVRRLIDGTGEQGFNEFPWDGNSQNGLRVASGTYFVQVIMGNISESRKVLIVER